MKCTILIFQIPCAECEPPHCYMIPKDNECYNGYFILEPDASLFDVGFGNHEFDYVFKIKVTNNAMLVSYQEFQVRVCFLKVET